MTTSSVLVIEDHEDTRLWWLTRLPEVFPGCQVRGVVTCEEAREAIAVNRFSLALVDINLPDGSGIELIQEFKGKDPTTICVVSTTFNDDGHIFNSLRAGADGYLIKDQPREEQIEQLKKVLCGEPPLSPGVASRILAFFSSARDEAEAHEKLTARERDVLQLLAKGYSRPEAAEILGLTPNTVASYTKVIYQKLDVTRRAEAVFEALRLGLISPD